MNICVDKENIGDIKMANFNNGVRQWQAIAEELNDIIVTTGKKIDKDDQRIWGGYLHRWSNDDWRDILSAFAAALEAEPTLAQPYRKTNLERARAKVFAAKEGERPLDRKSKGGKAVAWAMINTLRETWNELEGIDIANEDAVTKAQKRRHRVIVEQTEEYTRTTVFHDLFEVNE